MLKSIRQFFQSVFLRVNNDELKAFEQYLNIGENALFMKLPEYEKVHAIRTAKRMQEILHDDPDADERMMVRAALLHDIGRLTWKMTIFDKVWIKLMKYLMRPLYNRLAERGKHPDSKYRKIYVHKYHGEVAEDILKRVGTEQAIIDIIAKHAQRPKHTDPKELKLLRKADRTS